MTAEPDIASTEAEIGGLAKAPQHIQLAVELILLLEQQPIADSVMLAALQIVINDYRNKLKVGGNSTSHIPAPAS